MFLWLAHFSNWLTGLNIFQYTTFRAVMAALTALAFSLMFGPWTIRRLTALKCGQAVRTDGPQTHLVKNGTPTMGGSLILTAITVSTLLWGNWANPYIWILLGVLLATGALGFYDDWRKVVYKDPNGVSAKFKMVWQSSVAIICTAMCGACLGFLWFNAYPAQVFMGDVGALALGAALGTVAVIVRQEFVLVIMGGLFVVEAVSVMLQVGWYKKTKKRIFLMAPIHHHYEQKGWKETQVVVRFWIITIVLVLIGLSTLKIR